MINSLGGFVVKCQKYIINLKYKVYILLYNYLNNICVKIYKKEWVKFNLFFLKNLKLKVIQNLVLDK